MQNSFSRRIRFFIVTLLVVFSVCISGTGFAEGRESPQIRSDLLNFQNGEGPVQSINSKSGVRCCIKSQPSSISGLRYISCFLYTACAMISNFRAAAMRAAFSAFPLFLSL